MKLLSREGGSYSNPVVIFCGRSTSRSEASSSLRGISPIICPLNNKRRELGCSSSIGWPGRNCMRTTTTHAYRLEFELRVCGSSLQAAATPSAGLDLTAANLDLLSSSGIARFDVEHKRNCGKKTSSQLLQTADVVWLASYLNLPRFLARKSGGGGGSYIQFYPCDKRDDDDHEAAPSFFSRCLAAKFPPFKVPAESPWDRRTAAAAASVFLHFLIPG